MSPRQEYSTGCEVQFATEVEELLNRQDLDELGVTKEELKDSYFSLAEILGRKPNRSDLDESEYKTSIYLRVFGTWVKFLREIGEYTEASYHYPQGVHLGHILSILKVFGQGNNEGTQFDSKFIRMRGKLDEGRLGHYQRQVKYKIQAAMELGILPDDRNFPDNTDYILELTPLGRGMYNAFNSLLDKLDLGVSYDEEDIPSSKMENGEIYNKFIREYIIENSKARDYAYSVFLKMHSVRQMLAFLYQIIRSSAVDRSTIYEQFFQAPFVKQYCDQEGIDVATTEASRHRCPFLLNILAACDVIDTSYRTIYVKKLVLMLSLIKPYQGEEEQITKSRMKALKDAVPASPDLMPDKDVSILRELFGGTFLTNNYYLSQYEFIE